MIDVVKHNCSCEWEQLNSSHLLRLWRTGTSEFHYEAKDDDEAFDVSEMHAFFIHILTFILGDITRFKAKRWRICS